MIRQLFLALCLAASLARGEAATSAVDKSQFTLFAPTPREAMREMDSDRPSVTESPITVDAGHVQVELSLVDYAYDDDGGVLSDRLSVLPANLKLGLLSNVDVELLFTPYEHDRVRAGGHNDTAAGFGDDTEIRVKVNLWGNDGPDARFGETAFGLLPFVKLPTGTNDLSNDHVEGGLILPFEAKLPGAFDLAAMAEFDVRYDESSGGYGVDFVHSATLRHAVPGVVDLDAYVEYVGVAPCDTGGTYLAIASAGLIYQATPDWSVDCGGTAGISDRAEDFTLFVGTSFRR